MGIVENGAMADAPAHKPGRARYLVCVDGSPWSRVAVRFACLRAKNTQGHVVLMTVIAQAEFQHWMAVADVMRDEQREAAEHLLQELGAEVNEWAGVMPELNVREGRIGDEILAAVEEDQSINFLVVGAQPPDKKHGELISWLAGHLAGQLHIPLVIVPGNLTDEELVNLA
jgi:nucleotide-binding universal stress UspA family protein